MFDGDSDSESSAGAVADDYWLLATATGYWLLVISSSVARLPTVSLLVGSK